jgi:sugar phosphate isomerase/epimerase
VGFCYDSGHANLNKNFDELKRFRDRLVVTHLHDNKGDTDAHQYPGYGTINWRNALDWIGDFYKPLNWEVTHYADLFKGSMEEFLEKTVSSINRLS